MDKRLKRRIVSFEKTLGELKLQPMRRRAWCRRQRREQLGATGHSRVDTRVVKKLTIFNTGLMTEERVWSRQLFYMLTLSVNSAQAQKKVPDGQGVEAWRRIVEHYKPKHASRWLGMRRQILFLRLRRSSTSHRPNRTVSG